jgi:hypothetical protein
MVEATVALVVHGCPVESCSAVVRAQRRLTGCRSVEHAKQKKGRYETGPFKAFVAAVQAALAI